MRRPSAARTVAVATVTANAAVGCLRRTRTGPASSRPIPMSQPRPLPITDNASRAAASGPSTARGWQRNHVYTCSTRPA